MTLQNESYVLITGATSGIGYELAKVFLLLMITI